MAAERAGVKTVLIPKENEKDLEDVPEEIRKKLVIIPVETAADVAAKTLGLKLNR
jgi:ATP-dependent Lon protease